MNFSQEPHPLERTIYLEAADLESQAEREAFLERACEGDAHLRERVEHLLNFSEEGTLGADFDRHLAGVPEEAATMPATGGRPSVPEEAATMPATGGRPSVPGEAATMPATGGPSVPEEAATIPATGGPSVPEEAATIPATGGTSAPPPPATPFPSQGGENYEIGPELARGGMGSIRQAEDRKLSRTVALKIMHSHVGDNPDSQARFVREAEVLALLSHPNIVPIHDIVWENGHPLFYTMKLVKGRTLQQIIEELREKRREALAEYDLDHLLGIFLKVCDAIAFAHSRGIIHRDLKPENIMVGEFGEVLVMDWGIAKILHREAEGKTEKSEAEAEWSPGATLQGDVMGTPQYMSPEQADGNIEELDERSDIFSLGGILYAILVLRPPVEGKTALEVLDKVSRGEITSPSEFQTTTGSGTRIRRSRKREAEAAHLQSLPHIPAGRVPSRISAVVMQALARERESRYPTVGELAADVEAYRSGFATSVEDAGLATQLWLLVRRHKALFGTAFAALLVIVGLSTGFLVKVNAEKRAALAAEAVAEEEAGKARDAEEEARASLAQAQVALAETALFNEDPQSVLRYLEECPEEYRDENWHYLKRESDRELHSFDDLVRGVVADPLRAGFFYVLDQEGDGLGHYDAHSGEFEQRLPVQNGFAYLAISPDGKRLATISRNSKKLSFFGTNPLSEEGDFDLENAGTQGGTPFFFSGDGRYLLTNREGGRRLVIDPVSRESRNVAEGFFAVAPEANTSRIFGVQRGQLVLLDLATGETAWKTDRMTSSGGGLAVTSDRKYLLAGAGDGKVEIKRYHDRKTIRIVSAHSGALDAVLTGVDPAYFLTFGNGVSGKTIKLWNMESDTNLPVRQYFVKLMNDMNPSIAWDSRSGLVVCGLDGGWVFSTPANPSTELADRSKRDSVFFLDEETIAGGRDTSGMTWTLDEAGAAGSVRANDEFRIEKLPDLVRSRTGDFVLAASLWNAPENLNPGTFFEVTDGGFKDMGLRHGWCDSCGVSPGGEYLALGNSWSEYLFRRSTGNKWQKFNLGGGPRRLKLNLMTDGTKMLFPAAPTPRYLVSYLVLGEGSNYRHFELYDLEKREKIWTKELPHGSLALLLDPEGKRLYTGSPDGSVRGYDPLTLEPRFSFRAHDRDISVIAISPDGRRMATGDTRGLIRVWEVEEGKTARLHDELIACGGSVRAIDFSPSGAKLVGLSGDKIQLWHLKNEAMPDYGSPK